MSDEAFPGSAPDAFPGGPTEGAPSGSETIGGSGVAFIIFIDGREPDNANLTFRQGDSGIAIQETLKYPDGRLIDLTGKSVTLSIYPVTGGSAIWTENVEILYAPIGLVYYRLTEDDLATAGSFFRVYSIDDGAGAVFSYPEGFNLGVVIRS